MAVVDQFEDGIQKIIAAMGSTYDLGGKNKADRTVRLALGSLGKDNPELINAVGLDARTGYILPLSPLPEKFDTLTSRTNQMVYVVYDAFPVIVDDRIIGVKLILKG